MDYKSACRRGVRTRAWRVETHLDAWISRTGICGAHGGRRDESRRGTHECVRHTGTGEMNNIGLKRVHSFAVIILGAVSCSKTPPPDPICRYEPLPESSAGSAGQGAIHMAGST